MAGFGSRGYIVLARCRRSKLECVSDASLLHGFDHECARKKVCSTNNGAKCVFGQDYLYTTSMSSVNVSALAGPCSDYPHPAPIPKTEKPITIRHAVNTPAFRK